jgi:cupin 2 domain-containing protein
MIEGGNLFADIAGHPEGEQFTPLLTSPDVRIERIVSRGHASPQDFWYDQDDAEWVIVLAGSAGLLFEGEAAPRTLKRGDYMAIPAHRKHRIAWTDAQEPTVWLAVHHR